MTSGLTDFEKKLFKWGFDLIDKKGDDKIDPQELMNLMNALKFPYTDQQLQDLIAVADPNKTGLISYDQFLARFEHKDQSQLEKEIQDAFDIISAKDECIRKGALKEFFQTIGEDHINDEEINEIMDSCGSNGKLSKEEFVKMLHDY